MKPAYVPALALGIGIVAGLRALTAPAVVAWATREKMIRPIDSFAGRMLLASGSQKIAKLAVGEFMADKLPSTASRLSPLPLTFRLASGAACGAAICAAAEARPRDGALLGALGALCGAVAGFHIRKRLSQSFPDIVVALAEDALAVGAGAAIVFAVSNRNNT